MIAPDYVRQMARYNAWENSQLAEILQALSEEEVTRDRGAFFGSILGTLSHVLWGDAIWLCRWTDIVERPAGGITESVQHAPTLADWLAKRAAMDATLTEWAEAQSEESLAGDITWFSGATGREQRKAKALCITHMFNHQTHHRGQVHAMLTAAGSPAPVTDLIFMPEEA